MAAISADTLTLQQLGQRWCQDAALRIAACCARPSERLSCKRAAEVHPVLPLLMWHERDELEPASRYACEQLGTLLQTQARLAIDGAAALDQNTCVHDWVGCPEDGDAKFDLPAWFTTRHVLPSLHASMSWHLCCRRL